MTAQFSIDTPITQLYHLFHLQQQNHLQVGATTPAQRIAKLNRLLAAILRYRPEIKAAMYADFQKPPFEVDAVEVYPITGAIKHARSHLRRWMQPQRVPTPLTFAGSSSWIHYEPKGVCLIISPWNFPFNLSFVPLVAAIAAGNCVILKPSEKTPHSAALIQKIVAGIFEENEVAVITGGVETSEALLALPFHHIFFTGSPAIGKIVMQAAAQHLASVTLELGGKSPVVVDETADLATAAARIVRGKFANTGQICIAPDYVLVQESVRDRFVELLQKNIQDAFGPDAQQSASYARLVNDAHFTRLKEMLDDAVLLGARVLTGGASDAASRYLAPTLLNGLPPAARLMQEEIFGPLLPVLTYHDLQEAIDHIHRGERPLTMSIFSKNRQNIHRLTQETRSGGLCINHTQLHFYNHDLPFGGVNGSGIGKSHGWYSFEAFSNARAVYRQHFWGPSEVLKAPYTRLVEKAMEWTIKWF